MNKTRTNEYIKELCDEIEQLKSLVKLARDEYIEENSDGETDCVTPYDHVSQLPLVKSREFHNELLGSD